MCTMFSRFKSANYQPSGHMTPRQRPISVGATSLRCIDVGATLHKRHVLAWSAEKPIITEFQTNADISMNEALE